MGDRCDIRLDLGYGRNRGITQVGIITEDGCFIPIGKCVSSLSFKPNNEGEPNVGSIIYSSSYNIFPKKEILRYMKQLLGYRVGKQRKTTYKTIKRNCAKRNR